MLHHEAGFEKYETPGGRPSVQNLVDAYSGKSEQELLQALQGMSAEERAAMRTFARELAPCSTTRKSASWTRCSGSSAVNSGPAGGSVQR